MKHLLTGLALLISMLLLSALSCDDTVSPLKTPDMTGLIEGERRGEEISHDYDGKNIPFTFSNGLTFDLRFTDNPNLRNERITLSTVLNERYFNTESDIVVDFTKLKSQTTFELNFLLPKNLTDEEIGLFMYSPGTSTEEFDGYPIDFDYDPNTGSISAKITAPTSTPQGVTRKIGNTVQSGGSNYTRLTLGWALRSELADGSRKRVIKMPFYEQAGNTCWAACAKMMGRAYASISNSDQEIRLHDIVKYMGHSNFDAGLGIWGFRSDIPKYLNTKTQQVFDVSSYLITSRLRSEIVRKIDNGQPLILNLTYPGVGKHQILVIGYELDLVSIGRTSFKVLYHNPQNVDNESMYRWADFDWLMKDKWRTELIQILYADLAVPSSVPLQTLATPIFDKPLMEGGQSLGELAFIVRRFMPDGQIGEIPIHQVYKRSAASGYSWIMRAPSSIEIPVLPDTTAFIRLKQPVYNADETAKNQSLHIEAFDTDSWAKIYDEREYQSYAPGTNNHESYIPLDDFFDAVKVRNIRIYVQLLSENGNLLDGYHFNFKLAPKSTTEIDFQLSFELMTKVKSYTDSWEQEKEENYSLIIPLIVLKGDGISFSGKNERGEVSIVLDNANDPQMIRELKFVNKTQNIVGQTTTNHSTTLEFRNININSDDKKMIGIMIKRSGSSVCGYINQFTVTNRNNSPSMAESDIIDYWCNTNSKLEVSLLKKF